jgi:hypoxanthine-guanine phosphoribosyltransferase
MNFCKCGETGVDLEEQYMRGYGLNMEEIKREEI